MGELLMKKPEYQSNSIVNLMSSILNAFNCENNYAPLSGFDIDLNKYQHIVCMVVDGLGYNFLKKHNNSFLYQHLKQRITSVFPTTTASAVTAFLTAQAPLQHGLTGWYMYFKELATAGVSLPFQPRFSKKSFDEMEIIPSEVFNHENAFDKNNISYTMVLPNSTIDSAYSKHSAKNRLGYENHHDFFQVLDRNLAKQKSNITSSQNMILAYYPYLDEFGHIYGINSQNCSDLFSKIDYDFRKLTEKYLSDDTLFIITADHGLVDILPEKKLKVSDYPEIANALILPLCGEGRVPFCYVRPSKAKAFEAFVQNEFSEYCTMMTLEQALDENLFRLGEMNAKFTDRVGDYILFMKDGYILTDPLVNEKQHPFNGYHGGLSEDELYVPLIIL